MIAQCNPDCNASAKYFCNAACAAKGVGLHFAVEVSNMTKEQAIKHFGSVADLADALRVRTQAVYAWPEDSIPLLRQYQLERLTAGRLKVDRGRAA